MKFSPSYWSALLLFPLLILNTGSAVAQISVEEKIQEVEKNLLENIQIDEAKPMTIKERMEHYHVRGLSMAVIHDYKIEWAKGYGWADSALKIPVTTQTLFQAASISKSLNAVGVLKLVQDKKLDLYTDINTYLTSWKFPYDSLANGKKITIANLLSHTGGLTVHGFAGYEQGKELPAMEQILDGKKPANSAPIRSMYEPGIKSEYSGGGITISQLIVTDVTHRPYADYMKKEVLQPLGMTSSTYDQPPVGIQPALLAAAYDNNGKEIAGKYHIYPEQAAAGLWTNPTDLAKYIIETQLAYEGRSAKVLNQQTTKLRLTPYLNKSVALGVFIENPDSTGYFGHGGANEGFRSQYYGSLENGNGVVIMVNSDNGAIIQEVINSIAKVYDELKSLSKSETISDADLQNYTGNYQLAPQYVLTITKEGKQLYAQVTGQPKFPVFAKTETRFFYKVVNAQMEFIKDEKNNVTKLIFYQGGAIEAKKL